MKQYQLQTGETQAMENYVRPKYAFRLIILKKIKP